MMKSILKIVIYFTVFCGFTIFISNKVIIDNGKDKIFSETKTIPKNKVGLLLGTSKRLANGNINLYYFYRVKAAVELYESGKIEYIVVSGDNRTKSNNEPQDFKEDLMKGGIPEDKIFLDYAGFRTLDSVVRIKEVFEQSSITFISQEFHNLRAIYLAEYFKIKAIGYNAKGVTGRFALKTELREYLARVKVFVDIVFNVQPKFLGKKVEIK